MRDFVEEDADHGCCADGRGGVEGRGHGEAVGDVVAEVGDDVEVGGHFDFLGGWGGGGGGGGGVFLVGGGGFAVS